MPPNDEANESQAASLTPTDWSFFSFFFRQGALENPIFCVLSFFFSVYSLVMSRVKEIFFSPPIFLPLSLNLSFTEGTIRGWGKSFLHELPFCGRHLKGDGNCRAEGMTSGVCEYVVALWSQENFTLEGEKNIKADFFFLPRISSFKIHTVIFTQMQHLRRLDVPWLHGCRINHRSQLPLIMAPYR